MQKVTEKVSDADECHCGIFPYPFPHLGLNSQWALNKDRDAWICYLDASLGGRIKGELINTVSGDPRTAHQLLIWSNIGMD